MTRNTFQIVTILTKYSTKHRTSQIKYIVKASVTRRSAYDTGDIPMLDGDTQTLEQKLSGSWLASGDSNAATNVSENVAASSPTA